MKTNVKDGLFIIGEIPVDTATIGIADSLTGANKITFETGADGMYTVLAQTNSEGIVESLIIDVGEYAHLNLMNNKEISIDESLIIVNNGKGI